MFARSLKKRNSSRSVSKMARGVYILTTCVFTHGASVRRSSMRLCCELFGRKWKGWMWWLCGLLGAALWCVKLWTTITQCYIPVIPQVWYLSLKRPLSDWCLMVFFFCILIVRLIFFSLSVTLCYDMTTFEQICCRVNCIGWADLLSFTFWTAEWTKLHGFYEKKLAKKVVNNKITM